MDPLTNGRPASPLDLFNLSFVLLLNGQYGEGWRFYENRPAKLACAQQLSFPEWRGQDVETLLVLP